MTEYQGRTHRLVPSSAQIVRSQNRARWHSGQNISWQFRLGKREEQDGKQRPNRQKLRERVSYWLALTYLAWSRAAPVSPRLPDSRHQGCDPINRPWHQRKYQNGNVIPERLPMLKKSVAKRSRLCSRKKTLKKSLLARCTAMYQGSTMRSKSRCRATRRFSKPA